jgi:RNA polymerase sigma-70 factor (ECF subfamily)
MMRMPATGIDFITQLPRVKSSAGDPAVAQATGETSEAITLESLLALTAGGDRAAFRSLYDRSASRLFAVCLRITRDRSLAEDVLQETYVRVWERSRQFDPRRGSALAWLITIARNHAIDVVRRRVHEAAPPEEAMPDIPDPSALGGMEAAVEGRTLQRCLAELDEGPRRAIVFAYRDGLSYEELARRLGVPVGTAKTWVSRGLTRLRQCLDCT